MGLLTKMYDYDCKWQVTFGNLSRKNVFVVRYAMVTFSELFKVDLVQHFELLMSKMSANNGVNHHFKTIHYTDQNGKVK